jgi:hypothetical protein
MTKKRCGVDGRKAEKDDCVTCDEMVRKFGGGKVEWGKG